MRIVGVIDVRGGRAVLAVGGRRAEYAPIVAAAGVRVDGDASALASVYTSQLGVGELYVADLDAIERGVDAANRDVVAAVVAIGTPVWLDAGVSAAEHAHASLDLGASIVVVGLETLTSFDALAKICSTVGRARVAFSIDLRDGRPLTMPNAGHAGWRVAQIAERADDAGVGTVIVLDLARVGTGAGVDVDLMGVMRRAAPRVALFAGGGVRSEADIDALRGVGCDGALVATALLSGAVRVGQNQRRTRNVAD
jgi:phosphoribosylformimino-5-aminoimidazole carboxamide ribotide isomerase